MIITCEDNWNAKNSMNAMTLPVLVTGICLGNTRFSSCA